MRCALALTLAVVGSACGFNPNRSEGVADASIGSTVDAAPTQTADAAVDAALPSAIVAVQSVDPGYQDATHISISITAHAGNLLLAATYASAIVPVAVADTGGLSWTSLTTYSKAQDANCPAVQIQYWYAAVATTMSTTITITQSDAAALGMHIIEYSGVATESPIDTQLGVVAPQASNAMTTGPVTTTHFDATVALFADVNGSGTMIPGTGWNQRGLDSGFYTLVIDDTPGASPGTYTPAGQLPASKDDGCWVAAAVALRAR